MKLPFCVLALVIMLAPARAQEADQTAMQMPTVTLDSGFTITAVEQTNSDLENLLDVRKWRFIIKAPETSTSFTARLEVRRAGAETIALPAIGAGEMTDLQYSLMLAPADGDHLFTAKIWKMRAEIREFGPQRGGTHALTSFDNPLLDLQWKHGTTALFNKATDFPADGALVLMSFDSGEADDKTKAPDQTQLVLHFVGTPHQD